jgi:hypothetical protein
MLNALRDIQENFSASALQDIQEMDFTAPHLLLEVSIFRLSPYLNAHIHVAYCFPEEPLQTLSEICEERID